ncbi:MAG: 6-carboxytetrahydropterin synthase, partial [bacterium]
MHRITISLNFCYGHRLLNHKGKCRRLHGHNAVAEITLSSENLDEQGMVADFGDIKEKAGKWLDENLDHRML